jgi:hypothetical protein
VNATYQPVDKLTKDASHDRDEVIVADYPLLLDDLASLMTDRSIPLVLIKANVRQILEPLLSKDGFNVLNGGKASTFLVTVGRRNLKWQFRSIALSGSPEMTL